MKIADIFYKVARPIVCLSFCWIAVNPAFPQQQVLGSIVGRVHLARGDAPQEPVLVSLQFRGADIGSVYTDSQGTFGFHSLGPNPYTVIINDEQYQPVQMAAVLEPNSLVPKVFVDIALIVRESAKNKAAASPLPPGSNPNMIDVHEYSETFPKPAVREFEKGIAADGAGKRDDAIRHYQKAATFAPDFYLAHNNLGSDYLAKSDFPNARKEFERVIQLNKSDATAYFNLSNVCMLMSDLPQAQQNLDEGIRRQPDSALGQFLLGSLHLRLGRPALAEMALRRAVQLSPMMVQARLKLVNVLLQQGRSQDAVAELHNFLDMFPEGAYSAQAKQVLQRLEATAKPAAIPN